MPPDNWPRSPHEMIRGKFCRGRNETTGCHFLPIRAPVRTLNLLKPSGLLSKEKISYLDLHWARVQPRTSSSGTHGCLYGHEDHSQGCDAATAMLPKS